MKKTVNLSQTQAKSIFKRYATGIVKILKSKGVKMVKKREYANGVDCFCWDTCITEKSPSKIHIGIYHEKASNQYINYVNFVVGINYQGCCNETDLEKEIRITTENTIAIKYPLSKLRTLTIVARTKIPELDPEKKVAKQLYQALKCRNKIYSSTTRVKVKKAKEKIKKFTKNEADKIVESFFQ